MFTLPSRHTSVRNVSGQADIAPVMEMMEGRQLLSATVVYTPTSVTVKCDQAADSILIDNTGAGGTYNVTGWGITDIISTGTSPVVSTGVSIKVTSTSVKNNSITITNVSAKDITLTMGQGNDRIYIGGDAVTIARNLTISGGNGINEVYLYSGTVDGATKITGGSGTDYSYFGHGFVAAFDFAGPVTVNTGAGNDYVAIGTLAAAAPTVVFHGAVKIDTGIGDDAVDLGSTSAAGAGMVRFAGDLSIKLGLGTDSFDVNRQDSTNFVSVERNFLLDLGAGNDTTEGMPSGHLLFQPGGTTRAKTVIKSGPGVKNQALLTGLLNALWNTGRGITFNW